MSNRTQSAKSAIDRCSRVAPLPLAVDVALHETGDLLEPAGGQDRQHQGQALSREASALQPIAELLDVCSYEPAGVTVRRPEQVGHEAIGLVSPGEVFG